MEFDTSHSREAVVTPFDDNSYHFDNGAHDYSHHHPSRPVRRRRRGTGPVPDRLLSPVPGLLVVGRLQNCGSAAGALPVAVSFYPIQYLTEAIGGDHVSVTSLTPADQEPHDYDLSGKEVTSTLEGASLVAYVEGFQPSLDKAVTQVNGPTVLDLSSKVDLKHHEGMEDEEEHADESADEGAHKEADHDADSLDPHFWLDPVRMKSAATAIEEALATADPDHAEDYKTNLETLTSTLDGLDSSYQGGFSQCERKTFITSHAAFGYLADRYGLTQTSISGIDPEQEPSAADTPPPRRPSRHRLHHDLHRGARLPRDRRGRRQ